MEEKIHLHTIVYLSISLQEEKHPHYKLTCSVQTHVVQG